MAQQEAETLLADARKDGLDAAAAKQNVPVITSDFFTRKDMLPGLGPSPQFMDAVFSATEKSPPDVAPASRALLFFNCSPSSPLPLRPLKRFVAASKKNSRMNRRGRSARSKDSGTLRSRQG